MMRRNRSCHKAIIYFSFASEEFRLKTIATFSALSRATEGSSTCSDPRPRQPGKGLNIVEGHNRGIGSPEVAVRCDPATRLKSGDSEGSTRVKGEQASDAIQKLEPESKCNRREFPSSNRARNFVNWLIV
jgi:hypothetical protein